MIPHTLKLLCPTSRVKRHPRPANGRFLLRNLPKNAKEPGSPSPAASRASAELSPYESGDSTTEALRLLGRLGLAEDADDGFGAGGAHEDAAAAVQRPVQPLRFCERLRRYLAAADPHVLLHLRVARHDGDCFGERTAPDGVAEEQ